MKSVFITGMGSGLGIHLCETYLRAGYRVFGCDVIASSKEYETLKEEFGPSVLLFGGVDVQSTPAIRECAARVGGMTESIDVLINNAAIFTENSDRRLEDFDVDDSLRMLNINALGPLRVVKAFLPLVEEGEEKVIANISSDAGSISMQGDTITRYGYCMSKCALNMQTVILQRYLRDRGIRFLLIFPGWMRTAMGGPNATVDPGVSAAQIYDLVQRYKGVFNGDMFMDYMGNHMDW